MAKTGLTFYEIRIYEPDVEKSKKGTHHEFNKIPNTLSEIIGDDKYFDIVGVLNHLFHKNKVWVNEEKYKGVKIIDWHENNRVISGIIDAGNYGYVRRTMDKETKENMPPVDKNRIVFDPFYFLLKFPINKQVGLLITETKGRGGVYTLLTEWINHDFKENKHDGMNCSHIKLTTKPAIPVKLLKRFMTKGNIEKCRYIKKNASTDLFDDEDDREIKLTTLLDFEGCKTMAPDEFFSKYKDGVISYEDISYDDVIAYTTFEGSKKSISFKNQKKISSNFNISGIIRYDEGGNPAYDSIHRTAIDFAEKYYSDIWE